MIDDSHLKNKGKKPPLKISSITEEVYQLFQLTLKAQDFSEDFDNSEDENGKIIEVLRIIKQINIPRCDKKNRKNEK